MKLRFQGTCDVGSSADLDIVSAPTRSKRNHARTEMIRNSQSEISNREQNTRGKVLQIFKYTFYLKEMHTAVNGDTIIQ